MTLRSRFLALALLACASAAHADGIFQTTITIALPPVLPRLVVVQPGVQVVEDLDEEVFFVNGWYWVRRGNFWYRARDHRRNWVYAEPRFVPPGLSRIPPGHYRHYRQAEWKEMREEAKERRHAEKDEEKERRHGEKQREKAWKQEHKGKHHGHGDHDD